MFYNLDTFSFGSSPAPAPMAAETDGVEQEFDVRSEYKVLQTGPSVFKDTWSALCEKPVLGTVLPAIQEITEATVLRASGKTLDEVDDQLLSPALAHLDLARRRRDRLLDARRGRAFVYSCAAPRLTRSATRPAPRGRRGPGGRRTPLATSPGSRRRSRPA